MIKTNKLNFFP